MLLALCLSACVRDEEISGTYRCTGAEAEGLSLSAAELGGEAAVLVLEADGRGSLSRGGETGSVTWMRSGEGLTLNIGGEVCPAALWEDGLLLEREEGLTLIFTRQERLPAPTPSPSPLPEQYWYGWWSVEDPSGQMPETWYDCFACLESDEEGPMLVLWDEQSSHASPIARVWLGLDTENARLARSERGWFLLHPLGEGDWTLDLDACPLLLSGTHDAGGERFDYRICLRPWGDRWEGAEEHLPFRWYDWYLPRIEAGAPMPDSMDEH